MLESETKSETKSESDNSLTPNNALTPNNRSGELPVDPINEPGDSNQADAEDQYPHGLRLFLLAGASIMGVFLISLDQVCTHPPSLIHSTLNTQRRLSSEQRYPRSQTSSAALAMSLGTARPTL